MPEWDRSDTARPLRASEAFPQIAGPQNSSRSAAHRARFNHAVCSGRVPLAAPQQAIATDWTTAEKHLGLTPWPAPPAPRSPRRTWRRPRLRRPASPPAGVARLIRTVPTTVSSGPCARGQRRSGDGNDEIAVIRSLVIVPGIGRGGPRSPHRGPRSVRSRRRRGHAAAPGRGPVRAGPGRAGPGRPPPARQTGQAAGATAPTPGAGSAPHPPVRLQRTIHPAAGVATKGGSSDTSPAPRQPR